jgi:hypothetical protein
MPDLRTPGKYHRYKNGKITLAATQRGIADRFFNAILDCCSFKTTELFRFATEAWWVIIDQVRLPREAARYEPRKIFENRLNLCVRRTTNSNFAGRR